ncbi:hypothetical protein T4D_14551 [Trichinella pseudospiralis]|uniref:Uncharacterized protein n=1 Tax=Trichinella pseudospiralis TaxID=6337 RepID=A0A0V1G581_TRIPS|nr:hypothetical protein T4D_14551 [Trichinella pseudospiralis]
MHDDVSTIKRRQSESNCSNSDITDVVAFDFLIVHERFSGKMEHSLPVGDDVQNCNSKFFSSIKKQNKVDNSRKVAKQSILRNVYCIDEFAMTVSNVDHNDGQHYGQNVR